MRRPRADYPMHVARLAYCEHHHDHTATVCLPDQPTPLFFGGRMDQIRCDQGEWVIKRSNRLLERNAMLDNVGCRLLWVPFESHLQYIPKMADGVDNLLTPQNPQGAER